MIVRTKDNMEFKDAKDISKKLGYDEAVINNAVENSLIAYGTGWIAKEAPKRSTRKAVKKKE